jgi:Tfp pilus assembly PilM family ATPase
MSRLRQRSGAQGLFASWLTSPPPDAAVEITADRVSAAVIGSRGAETVVQAYAVEPLPAGALVPSLTAQNVIDREVVIGALRRVLDRLGTRPARVALIVPDLVARVSLVHFDQIPVRREDLDQLVRWQVRKAAPFAIEEAAVSYSAGARADGGGDFIVELARRNVIQEYEGICEGAGAYAGLVDVATLSVVNFYLAAADAPTRDWLLVHMRPSYTSIVIMRDDNVIFFRSRPEGDEEPLADLVHQTAMYYQDRLSGTGFARVLLGGNGRAVGALDAARRSLEDRLGATVESADPTRLVTLTDRITTTPDVADVLSPLLGMLLRAQREAAA